MGQGRHVPYGAHMHGADVRQRPNPKANRPRTKTRPEHKDAVAGRVFSVDRGRYGVWVDENTPDERQLVATMTRRMSVKCVAPAHRADDASGVGIEQ